jgi:hypothetical protein
MVKVYPIWLKTYEDVGGKNMKIDAGYAAQVSRRLCSISTEYLSGLSSSLAHKPQAIEAALDKNATIISMSWHIPMIEATASGEARDRRDCHMPT